MKRFALIACASLILLTNSSVVRADWGHLGYSGRQPWYNFFAWGKRPKLTPEEQRLEGFWHDYYDAQGDYYRHLKKIDWVAYYKNHGYEINQGGCGSGGPYAFGGPFSGYRKTSMVPMVVTPRMEWAVPSTPLYGQPLQCPPAPAAAPVQGYAVPPGAAPAYAGQGYPVPVPGYGGPGYGGPG